MKNFSFSILFAFLFIALFASCDNEYNNLNKGNGIFYYGLDNELRGFYGFLKGEQYYFEDHKDYKVCNISTHCIDVDDVYLLTNEIHNGDSCRVVRKNGKILYKDKDLPNGIFFVYNGKLRIYSKFRNDSIPAAYYYKPYYWEDGQCYDVVLETPTFVSIPLFAQVEQLKNFNGSIYYFGYILYANGKTTCVWKDGKLISYYDPTKNSSLSAKGFYIDNDENIFMFRDIEKYYDDKNGNTYPSIAAIFKNGELLKAFYDENVMTSYSRYYKTCACALYSYNNDIYLSYLEHPSFLNYINDLVVLKNNDEVCRVSCEFFHHMLVYKGNIYSCVSFYTSTPEYVVAFFENDNPIKMLAMPQNQSIMISGMFAIP